MVSYRQVLLTPTMSCFEVTVRASCPESPWVALGLVQELLCLGFLLF